MKEVLIILDGLMEAKLENSDLKQLILGDLEVKYKLDMVDFSVKGKDLDSLNCIMNILGYSSQDINIGERAYYEGLSQDIKINDKQCILRCNIVKIKNGILEDFTGGNLEDTISNVLKEMKMPDGFLYPCYKYKNLLVLNDFNQDILKMKFYPPHFNIGKEVNDILPNNEMVKDIISNSYEIFKENNMEGCMLWPWGPSKNVVLKSFEDKCNKKAGLISGIDLVSGMGKALKMKTINLSECNGDYDTNLEGKLIASIELVKEVDVLIVHINGFDELAHRKDFEGKLEFIKKVQKQFFKPLIENLKEHKDYCINITCDHRTDSFTGNHEKGLVPLIRVFN